MVLPSVRCSSARLLPGQRGIWLNMSSPPDQIPTDTFRVANRELADQPPAVLWPCLSATSHDPWFPLLLIRRPVLHYWHISNECARRLQTGYVTLCSVHYSKKPVSVHVHNSSNILRHVNKKLSCRREAARCFVSLNTSLSQSRSLKLFEIIEMIPLSIRHV